MRDADARRVSVVAVVRGGVRVMGLRRVTLTLTQRRCKQTVDAAAAAAAWHLPIGPATTAAARRAPPAARHPKPSYTLKHLKYFIIHIVLSVSVLY